MNQLAERLERTYSAIIFDIVREMGFSPRVLPRSITGLVPAMRAAGPVFTVRGRPDPTIDAHESLLEWTKLLSSTPSGSVVVCQPQDDVRALMGELSAEALKLRGVRGYIVDGGCRDVDLICEQDFPVFCRYFTPIDIVAAWRAEEVNVPVTIGNVTIQPDDYVMADRDGIILIPGDAVEDVLTRAEAAIATESELRKAIRAGEDPQSAYLKYRKF